MSFINDAFSVIGPAVGGLLTGGPFGAIAGGLYGLSTLNQNSINRENQAAQNDYNSPANQMARYRAAGLNPNLIYSQGSPGNQSQPVQTEGAAVDMFGAKMKMLALQAQQTQNQILKHNEQAAWQNIDRVYYDGLLKATKQLGEVTRNQLLDANIPYAHDLARYNAENQSAKVNQILGDVNLKAAHMLNLDVDNKIKAQILDRETHWNMLRKFGIEPTDKGWPGLIMRGGLSMGQRYVPHFNQHLRH